MSRRIPTSRGSSSESARVIDLRPETSFILWAWWGALHGVVLAALVLLDAPWVLKAPAALTALAHAVVLRPRRTPRLVWRQGRVSLPELGLDDLTLGGRTRHCRLWIRLDLRGSGRVLDILLLVDQIEPVLWRTLRAELARLALEAPGSGEPKRDLR